MKPVLKANIHGLVGAVLALLFIGAAFGFTWLLMYHKAITVLVSILFVAAGIGWGIGAGRYVGRHQDDFEPKSSMRCKS